MNKPLLGIVGAQRSKSAVSTAKAPAIAATIAVATTETTSHSAVSECAAVETSKAAPEAEAVATVSPAESVLLRLLERGLGQGRLRCTRQRPNIAVWRTQNSLRRRHATGRSRSQAARGRKQWCLADHSTAQIVVVDHGDGF